LPENGSSARFRRVSPQLEEVKKEIESLPADEVLELKDWLLGKAETWDRQMIEDIEAGRLRPLLEQLDTDIAAGDVTQGFKRT
jgi:hypothetical protein